MFLLITSTKYCTNRDLTGFESTITPATLAIAVRFHVPGKKKDRQNVSHFSWQGYMDEDRTFYSVSENAISGGKNV